MTESFPSDDVSRSERVEFPSRGGKLLVGDLHRAGDGDGPWLLLCHGMESTRGGTKQEAMCARFVPRGFSVLRFDFRYVGESEGEFEDLTVSGEVDDALGALDFAAGFRPREITLVGSSLGGLVALLVAAAAPHQVRRLVTIAAVADERLFLEGLSPEALERWRREGRRPYGSGWLKSSFLEDVCSLDTAEALGRLELPILALHGEADSVVPVAHAGIIGRLARGPVTVKTFPGVDHRFEEPGALDGLLEAMEHWLLGEGGAA
jgi:pimeloyl-ACP methyl ester carboxylesterase